MTAAPKKAIMLPHLARRLCLNLPAAACSTTLYPRVAGECWNLCLDQTARNMLSHTHTQQHAQYRCTYLHTNIMHKHVHSEQYARHILSKRGGLVRLTSNTLFLFSSLLKPFKNCLRASQATHKGELNQVCRWWLHIKRLLEADKQHALQVLKSSASTMAPVPNLTLNAYLPLC